MLISLTKGFIRKKEGYRFFLGLLIVSGAVIFCLGILFFYSREIALFTFKRFVINKAFVSMLPKEYTLEKAESIRSTVYYFYEHAEEQGVLDRTVMRVSQRVQEIMADEKMTHEEVQSLLMLVEQANKNE
ncbi:MAG: hypothetical protein AAB300_03840 [Nitrospirota bacterium]